MRGADARGLHGARWDSITGNPPARGSRLRIGLDCSSAASVEGTGIAHYIRHLVAQFAAAPQGGDEYVVCWRLSRHAQRHALTADLPSHIKRAVLQAPFAPLGAGRLDVFHGLDVRVPWRRRPPCVATVHDIFSVITDEFAEPKFRRKKIAQYQRTIERATAVLCVSHSTANDLRTHLDAPPEKLVVVHSGVDGAFRPEASVDIDRVRARVPIPIPEHYLLYVGKLDRRKNVTRLVHAFEQAAPDLRPDLHLILVGGLGYGAEETLAAIETSPVRDRIVRLEHMESGHLPPLYASASGFAFPTLYEGFGLPILEAMACGCPTLIGNVGAAPEVGGDAVLSVDPTDTQSIAAGLHRMMTDDVWRVAAIQGGLKRAAEFTWARTARATRRVYHCVAAGEPLPQTGTTD